MVEDKSEEKKQTPDEPETVASSSVVPDPVHVTSAPVKVATEVAAVTPAKSHDQESEPSIKELSARALEELHSAPSTTPAVVSNTAKVDGKLEPLVATVPVVPESPLPMNQAMETSESEVAKPTTADTPKKMKMAVIGLLALGLVVVLGGAVFGAVALTGQAKIKKESTAKVAITAKDIDSITLNIADGDPDHFYPQANSATNNTSIDMQIQMFEGLVGYQDGTQIVPLLAQSWSNPSDTRWIFKLKPNVKFHNGHNMTSKEVKASIDGVKTSDVAYGYAGITNVLATDDATVEIDTAAADPTLLNRLSRMYIYDTSSEKKNSAENGTGPYIVKPGSATSSASLELVAYDGYHGGHVQTRALNFKKYNDNGEPLLKDFYDNKLQIVFPTLKADSDTLASKGYASLVNSVGLISSLRVNLLSKGSPLLDIRVRKAISMAIDVDALLKFRNIEGKQVYQVMSSYIPGYDPAQAKVKYDLEGAKKLMKEAGFANGVTIKLTHHKLAQSAYDGLKPQLEKIGITLVSDVQQTGPAIAKTIDSGAYQLVFSSFSSDLNDASDVYTNVMKVNSYKNPDVADLMVAANRTIDRSKRLDLLKQINNKLHDDLPEIPLYERVYSFYQKDKYVIKHDVAGINMGIYFWKVHRP